MPTDTEVSTAIRTLAQAGAVILMPGARRSFSLAAAAVQLDVSTNWMRENISEFPGAYRLPGGGRNGGEWRIPGRDLEQFEERRTACRGTKA